jgi:hypothetical protein
MRSAILMGSVAAIALATPAFAVPDRYEQGYSCTGRGVMCTQQQLRLEDGNRFDEKSRETPAISNRQSSADETQNAARADSNDGFADEAGDEISDTADEAGDEISNAADEVGDEIGDAADEVGDAIDDAF